MKAALQHKAQKMTQSSSPEVSSFITEYNQYIDMHLKKILDFDAWYEMTTNREFPKEWYSDIRNSRVNK